MRLSRDVQRVLAAPAPITQACVHSEPTAEELQVLAITRFQAGEVAVAEAILRSAAERFPGSADVRNNLGAVLKAQSKIKQATEEFRAAIISDPNHAGAHANLGDCLAIFGDQEAAILHLGQAVQIDPRHVGAWLELVVPLARVGRFQEALAALQTAVNIDPVQASKSSADLLARVGFAFLDWDRPAEAEHIVRQARSLQPFLETERERDRKIFTDLGFYCQHAGMVTEALGWFERALDVDPSDVTAHSHYQWCSQYCPDITPEASADRAFRWAEKQLPMSLVRRSRASVVRDKVRIGYVSPDLWDRPAAYCLESLLGYHDRDRFQVYLYGNCPVFDSMTARLRRNADYFRCIHKMTDEEVCDVIEYDEIDILVDLAGFTEGHRIGVFARKPAPVQVEWLGYYATTGLPQIDYFLCHPCLIPSSEEHLYAEKPVRLESDAFSFDPPKETIEIGPLPALSNGFVTFGSSAYLAKVTPEVVAAWSAVLIAVPGSRFAMNRQALMNPRTRDRFLSMFVSNGIDPSRIDFLSTSTRMEYLEELRRLDILLDTFPFNGGTSTYEALWMGLPVVTKSRPRMVGHFTESILAPLGYSSWVASDEVGFVRAALGLTSDLEGLASLRSRLRDELCSSCLCDAQSFAREIESAFLRMFPSAA